MMHTTLDGLNLLGMQVFGVSLSLLGTIALWIIMLTMGLTLTLRDFAKIGKDPRGVALGLVGQLLVLPLAGFFLVWLLQPPLAIGIGLILLAACPGGATSNFFCHLARGDVALSIVLTVISGMAALLTVPFYVNLGLDLFAGEASDIRLPVVRTMVFIFITLIVPVVIGMSFRHAFTAAAAAIEPWATRLSFALVLFTMGVMLWSLRHQMLNIVLDAGLITLLLNASMMLVGFSVARRFALGERQARSISIEIGVQNYILSFVIALSLLQRAEFAITGIMYLFVMYMTVFSFIAWSRARPLPATEAAA